MATSEKSTMHLLSPLPYLSSLFFCVLFQFLLHKTGSKEFFRRMKTIGLIGGMSWESSAIYYDLINKKVREILGGFH